MDKHAEGLLELVHLGKDDHVLIGGPFGSRYTVAEIESKGDAARLLATWNACDGIPADHLQPGAVKALVAAAEKALERLEELDGCWKSLGNVRMGINVSNEVWALKDILRKFRGMPEPAPSGYTQLTAEDVLDELKRRAELVRQAAEGGTTHDDESR